MGMVFGRSVRDPSHSRSSSSEGVMAPRVRADARGGVIDCTIAVSFQSSNDRDADNKKPPSRKRDGGLQPTAVPPSLEPEPAPTRTYGSGWIDTPLPVT